ncbi:DNA polymerase III subunit gamma/tau [Heliorestis acidaminivorans]|nr:DNA polymerase III subunit gamma/tau [Heliorestis acidaminivorans]
MAYLALYREWRPGTFQELVGQEHVSCTLQNALLYQRIAHAYLFCGPRGTGKTTTAKVLAKALNCSSSLEAKRKPCNDCSNCRAINNGSSHDVLEIDAASNRGVDEIRELREQVKYAPQEGTYKVYIIDEVHMLTTEAFNALLKTLEEPPANVIFVLATTEVHKIPATILSRCQRFDFRRLDVAQIVQRLREIATHYQLEISDDTLHFIARKAEGGMRDALSILDQAHSFAGSSITIEDITSILGAVSDETLFEISQYLAEGQLSEALLLLHELISRGKEIRPLTRDLLDHYRDRLILTTIPKSHDLVNLSPELSNKILAMKSSLSADDIQRALALLSKAETDMKWTSHPRLLLEVAFIRIANQEDLEKPKVTAVPTSSTNADPRELQALRQRIEELEKRLARVNLGTENIPPPPTTPLLKEPSSTASTASYQVKSVAPSSDSTITLEQLQRYWPEVLEKAKEYLSSPPLRSILRNQTSLDKVHEKTVYLQHSCPLYSQPNDPRLKDLTLSVKKALLEIFSQPLEIALYHESQGTAEDRPVILTPSEAISSKKNNTVPFPKNSATTPEPLEGAPLLDEAKVRQILDAPDLEIQYIDRPPEEKASLKYKLKD